MPLDSYFGIKRVNVGARVEQRKTENMTKEEQRQMELDYLKPDPLLPYTGVDPAADPISRLTVKLVFPDNDRLEQFKRHFKVARYVEPSVTNIGVLIALLDELDLGRIVYDRTTGRINYATPATRPIRTRQSNSQGGTTVATAKQRTDGK